MSLTADGNELSYSLQLAPSVIRVIPTGAAPGVAAGRGRTVVRAPAGRWVSFSVISADGSKAYFSTTTQAYSYKPITVQLRVTDLATGRSRVLYAPPWQPGLITADPGVRYLLVQSQDGRKLVRLNLATGKATALPPGPFALPAVLYW